MTRHGIRSKSTGVGGAVHGRNDRLIDLFAVLRPQAAAPSAAADDLSWQDESLCSQADPEAWFPEKGGSTRQPKAICARCPVREPCLEFALRHDERFGVYGGLSERERRSLRRRFGDDVAAAVASVIPSAGKAAA